ncbi:MAG: DinB family protein [Flavisolibacter sp.]
MQTIIKQINEAWDGEPWFGRSIKELLFEIEEHLVFEKPSGQHSILELLWHMNTWKAFTISRLKEEDGKPVAQFEADDWRVLDHSDRSLWQKGLHEFESLQNELAGLVEKFPEAKLSQTVRGRTYDFRHLLNGIVQHDIYHIGQIAYLKKILENK